MILTVCGFAQSDRPLLGGSVTDATGAAVAGAKVEAASVEVKNVELAVGQPRTIDAQMQVGALTEAVTVTAELETLNRSTAEIGGLVNLNRFAKSRSVDATGPA